MYLSLEPGFSQLQLGGNYEWDNLHKADRRIPVLSDFCLQHLGKQGTEDNSFGREMILFLKLILRETYISKK